MLRQIVPSAARWMLMLPDAAFCTASLKVRTILEPGFSIVELSTGLSVNTVGATASMLMAELAEVAPVRPPRVARAVKV